MGSTPLLQQMPHFWWPWFAPRIFGASGFQISTVTELWWWSCDLHLGGSFSCPSFRGHVYFVQSGEKAWSGPGGIASSGDSWFSKIKFGKDNNQHDLAEDIDIDIIGYRGISGDHMFSRMRSKGSRFTLGVWGLRVCSLDVAFTSATVRNRPQPFATVRNRPQPSARLLYGRAYGKFCRRGPFRGFKRLVASFRVAGVALRDIQTCFVTCRKSFCVAGAIL